MRRLVGLALMAALMAPALAVCAGGMAPSRPPSEHDCCPKEHAVLQGTPAAPAAGATCCRMSSDAARRGAVQSIDVVLPSTPVETIADWISVMPEAPLLGRHVNPPLSPHVARHLLLSVLIV